MIERHDAGGHAERLAHRDVQVLGAGRDGLAFHLDGEAGVPFELLGGLLDVAFHLRDGVAGVHHLGVEQFFAALADALGHLLEIFSALLDIERRPGRLRLLGGGDRPVHVGRVAGGELADLLLSGRD